MSKTVDVLVPDIGDFHNVPVIEVPVFPGASVKRDDPLAILESDKASMDVPSPHAGRVVEVLVKVGDKVSAGARLATLEVEDETASILSSVGAPTAPLPSPAPSSRWQPETPVPPGDRGAAALAPAPRGQVPMASGVVVEDLPMTDGVRPSPTASIPLVIDEAKSEHHAAPAV